MYLGRTIDSTPKVGGCLNNIYVIYLWALGHHLDAKYCTFEFRVIRTCYFYFITCDGSFKRFSILHYYCFLHVCFFLKIKLFFGSYTWKRLVVFSLFDYISHWKFSSNIWRKTGLVPKTSEGKHRQERKLFLSLQGMERSTVGKRR